MTHEPTARPADLGFAMPPEWAPHRRTWMMWPCRSEVWPDFAATRRAFAAVAHAIAAFEPVAMCARPEDLRDAADVLGSDIDLVDMPLDDSWARDSGPTFLVGPGGARAAALFRFNAWGGKYTPYQADAEAGRRIADHAGVPAFQSRLVAEGGGFSVDGEGTLLTTRTCFPNANRNPGLPEAAIEAELKTMLGVRKVVWLPGNAEETETDGHVDGIAVFAAPGRVLVEADDDADDPSRATKAANNEALAASTDASGRTFELIRLPEAPPDARAGRRYCRSYVNGYICNGAVIVPAYDTSTDALAREIYEAAFPGRRIVPVDVRAIAVGGGGIHCITQQEV